MENNKRVSFPKKIKEKLSNTKLPMRLVFILTGIASTIWFLIRVIPKPNRATYPCMRVAAPIMSSFVIYLLSITGSFVAFKKAKDNLFKAKYLVAAGFFVGAVVIGVVAISNNNNNTYAETTGVQADDYPSNKPIGQGQGIYPGRVVWVHDKDATNENCNNDNNGDGTVDSNDDGYFLPKNNDDAVIDKMMDSAILNLTGQATTSEAWDTLFKYFNKKKHDNNAAYTAGEKIFIKTNATSSYGMGQSWGGIKNNLDRNEGGPYGCAETSPFPVLSILRQLVNDYGVNESDIYVGDPMKNIYNDVYDIWHGEFPNINYLDNSTSSYGRTKVTASAWPLIFYSESGTILDYSSDNLYQVLEDADYLINIAAFKGHMRAGITLCAKNHFGSNTRDGAGHLHPGLVDPEGTNDAGAPNTAKGTYRVLVDIMGSQYMGGNTMLFIVDGLWGGPHDTKKPAKFQMAPFNDDWTNSIFMSQDQVALESVCFDFLRTELDGSYTYPELGETYNFPNMGGVDDYLEQAADSSNWPDDIDYSPDAETISSLGVHEHWNNATDKRYNKNLDNNKTKGIHLLSVPKSLVQTSKPEIKISEQELNVFPNPSKDWITIKLNNKSRGQVLISIYDLSGKQVDAVFANKGTDEFEKIIDIRELDNDIYIIKIQNKAFSVSSKISKI